MKKLLKGIFILLVLQLILPFEISAQQISTDTIAAKQRKVKVLPVPSFGYEPETKTHFGAVVLFNINLYQDSLTRSSNAKVEFNYSLRRQSIIESEWNYFFKEEKWFTKGILHFSIYPDFYYGIGPCTPIENEILYSSKRIISDIAVYKNFKHKIFFGGGMRYVNYNDVASEKSLESTALRSTITFGIHTSIFQDTRNNLLNASRGVFSLLKLEYNNSDKNYYKIQFDMRRYYNIKYNFVLAARIFNNFTIGIPSFYDYAILGGDEYVRGYFYGRYRDKNLTTLQTEIRTPIVWRCGLAIIGGISTLYPNFQSFSKKFRPNYGLGFRFLIDKSENINLRIDYVIGSENNAGFYVSFGESF